MQIQYLGHNTLSIKTAEHTIVIDPFINGNPLIEDKSILDRMEADFILLTHAHQDHVLDAEALAKRTGATIVSNYEIAMHYGAMDIPVHPMNHGGHWSFPFGRVKYVAAVHTSGFADGKYGGEPGGFVIEADGKTVYIAGDTALTMDMKLIPMEYDLDLAVLPIGDNFTMGYEDALHASKFVKCDRVLGVHYDTFGYIEIDKQKAKATFDMAGKTLILLPIEGSITV